MGLGSGIRKNPIPDSEGQKTHRIADPQHWIIPRILTVVFGQWRKDQNRCPFVTLALYSSANKDCVHWLFSFNMKVGFATRLSFTMRINAIVGPLYLVRLAHHVQTSHADLLLKKYPIKVCSVTTRRNEVQGREGGRRWTLFSASDDRGHLPLNFVVFFSSIFFNFRFRNTAKLIRDFLNNRVDYAQRELTESRKAETGKLEWPESQNDRKARMTGKAGTTGMIPTSIYYSNNAPCTHRWGGPKYNLLIILSRFFLYRMLCTALTCTSWEIKPNIITGN